MNHISTECFAKTAVDGQPLGYRPIGHGRRIYVQPSPFYGRRTGRSRWHWLFLRSSSIIVYKAIQTWV